MRELFAIALEEQMSMREIARRAGLSEENISYWKKNTGCKKRRRTPLLESMDACLKPLGYKLAIVPETFHGVRMSYENEDAA